MRGLEKSFEHDGSLPIQTQHKSRWDAHMSSTRPSLVKIVRYEEDLIERPSNLFFQRDRQSVANGKDRREEIFGVVELAVELENGFGSGVRWIFFCHAAAPKHIVGDKEASLPKARGDQAKHARVVIFVDIIKDDVELFLL